MRTHLKRKEVDDVLGGKDSWANVDVVDGKPMPALAGPHSFTRILRSAGTRKRGRERGRRRHRERG